MLSDIENARLPAGRGKDFLSRWRSVPNGGVLLCLLAAWVVLFQFLGNSTLGYVNTPSLFGWWQWTMRGISDQYPFDWSRRRRSTTRAGHRRWIR